MNHGGYDPGAVNGSRKEKDDNLRLSLLVAKKLRQQGQKVVMTRDTDVFVSLARRAAISNATGPNIFVSIHRNAFSDPNAHGYETIINTVTGPNTEKYARDIHNEVVAAGVQRDRGVKRANLAVLRGTRAPAVLLEMGFITNTEDNRLFDQKLDQYATAITKGILKALEQPYNPDLNKCN